MTTFFKTKLALILAFSVLVLQFSGISASSNTAQVNAPNSDSFQTSTQIIVVSVAAPAVKLNVVQPKASSLAVVSNCFAALSASAALNDVQDEPALNLNQPANCFSLQSSASQPQILAHNLAVYSQPAGTLPKIVIHSLGVQITLAFVQNTPQNLPMLPVVSLALIIAVVWRLEDYKPKRVLGLAFLQNFSIADLNVFELQNMRC